MIRALSMLALLASPALAQTPFPGVSGPPGPGVDGLVLSGQLFSGYRAQFVEDDARFTEFFLDRAELGAHYEAGGSGLELRLEAVRALGPRSLVGVDGDSLVVRLRRAWGWWGFDTGPLQWTLAGGLVPDPWIRGLESQYHLRATGPLLTERGGFFSHSDLGALLAVSGWQGRAALVASATNGEGRTEREQNDGKDLGAYLKVVPLRLTVFDARLDVALHGVYRNGSQGVGRVRHDRYGGGLTVEHPFYGLGAVVQRAEGYQGRSAQSALGVDVWADARLHPPWLGVMAHWSSLTVAPEAADDARRTRWVTGLFADLAALSPGLDRLRVYALFQHDSATDEGAPVPGVPEAYDAQTLLLRLEVTGSAVLPLRRRF